MNVTVNPIQKIGAFSDAHSGWSNRQTLLNLQEKLTGGATYYLYWEACQTTEEMEGYKAGNQARKWFRLPVILQLQPIDLAIEKGRKSLNLARAEESADEGKVVGHEQDPFSEIDHDG